MVRESAIVALRWEGRQSVKAAREAIAAGSRVEIELPLENHYALYRHLRPDAQGRGTCNLPCAARATGCASPAPSRYSG
jgi:hypothetical protein